VVVPGEKTQRSVASSPTATDSASQPNAVKEISGTTDAVKVEIHHPAKDMVTATVKRKQVQPKAASQDNSVHLEHGSKIEQQSNGDCSPNMIGSGNTNNCNQPPRVIASVQTQEKTGDPDVPWENHFTLASTGIIQTGDLRLKCNGPVIRAGISRINPAELITGSNGPDPNDANTVVYELGQETMSPKQTVTITVYSRERISVLSGTIGYEQIVF
jgi:hypothetical protein